MAAVGRAAAVTCAVCMVLPTLPGLTLLVGNAGICVLILKYRNGMVALQRVLIQGHPGGNWSIMVATDNKTHLPVVWPESKAPFNVIACTSSR